MKLYKCIALLLLAALLIFLIARGCKKQGMEMEVEFPASQLISLTDADTGERFELDLEEYVCRVTAAEMPASYEVEALRAQAVCARTYAVYKLSRGAELCTSSAHCQAYRGEEELRERWGADYPLYSQKIRGAVADTRGQIITYGEEAIEVMYHAVSGGRTEDVAHLYGSERPYLVSVESPGEEFASSFYGSVTVSREEFCEKLNAHCEKELLSPGDIEIEALRRYDSGRVEYMSVGGERIAGTAVRKLFSLKSANFTVTVGDAVTFSTVGYGHGVGMSQAGAQAMAKNGSSFCDILAHYFTGTTLNKMY